MFEEFGDLPCMGFGVILVQEHGDHGVADVVDLDAEGPFQHVTDGGRVHPVVADEERSRPLS